MKSGLEGRNNVKVFFLANAVRIVSMKSGLEGRNNISAPIPGSMGSITSQ